MWNLEIGFDRPAYLVLLLVLPVLWVLSYRSLASLGKVRRWVALTARSLVVLFFVLALAEMQWQRTSSRLTVIYLLDQSASIPRVKRDLMREYVIREVHKYRRTERGDRAGVVIFGRDAAIEVPPFDDDIPDAGSFETMLPHRDATNLESALKLAQASFSEDTAKRIVIVTDGNENIGNAQSVAPNLTTNGIGIDVLPVKMETRAEVAIEKVTIPSDVRRGTPFEVRTVLNNYQEQGPKARTKTVRGRLRVTRLVGSHEELIGEQTVELPPGKTVIGFKHSIDKPAMYTYRSVFVPDDPEDDLMPQNNEATAFTYVRGKGRVLLIENSEQPGEFDYLVERLRLSNLEIEVRGSDQPFESLAELQGFDCVVLADVPRSTGFDTASISSFRDEQISMLVRNTEQMGAGLVMLGGPNSFGAGGWANTELEKAMPIDFQIRNAKISAVGALVLTMHASEMAQGNFWQKKVAHEAIKALGPMDFCGVVHWDNVGGDAWLWGGNQGLIRIAGQRNTMLAMLARMTPGDMPEFEPSMRMALTAFSRVNASVKHMIIISDGDPSPPSATILARFRQAGIKITTVAVATHGPAASRPLKAIAAATKGNYYEVTNPKVLPKIYQREARRVSRPLIKSLDDVSPQIVYPHEMLEGIDGPLPPLKGMVLSTVKQNPLVEVVIRSPVPSDPKNSTVLAAWTYGLGRSVAWTTDAGHRWGTAWTSWDNYDKFFSQLIRWAMRPTAGQGKYAVASDVRDGKVRVVITALSADDRFRNLLNMSAAAVGPDLKSIPLKIRQEAPGRYVGQFDVTQSGSYLVTVVPNPGEPPILTGVNVPYSAEYRKQDTNYSLLKQLVSLQPAGGEPGLLIDSDLDASNMDKLLSVDTFRHNLPKAFRVHDAWPALLWVAAFLFLVDVFVRRVAIGTEWIAATRAWIHRRIFQQQSPLDVEKRLERLQQSKAEIARSIDQRRMAARFQPDPDATDQRPASGGALDTDPTTNNTSSQTKKPPATADSEEDQSSSYTDRLLEAKKKAWKERS